MPNLDFDSKDLLASLESASSEDMDQARMGIIRLTSEGFVTAYNSFESELSGLSPANVIGRHFFTDVAPCTNNFMVAQKFEDLPELDQKIDYVFTYRMLPTGVHLRMLRSSAAVHRYLIVKRIS